MCNVLLQVMMKLTDQLFKRKLDEAEKEFTFTEFLNLVDRCVHSLVLRCESTHLSIAIANPPPASAYMRYLAIYSICNSNTGILAAHMRASKAANK